MPFPSMEWLGLFPTWEGLILQAVILIMAASIYIRSRNARAKTHPAEGRPGVKIKGASSNSYDLWLFIIHGFQDRAVLFVLGAQVDQKPEFILKQF